MSGTPTRAVEEAREPASNPVERRIQDLTQEALRSAGARRRQSNRASALGIAIAVACVLSLSALTRMGRRLDTDAVAQIGRAQLMAHIPTSRAALQQHLERDAPVIVRSSFEGLLDHLPRLSAMVTAGATENLRAMNEEFGARVVQLMAESIGSTRDRLAGAWPELGDSERVERLAEEVAADFSGTFAQAIDELYPEYQQEMADLTSRLTALRDADASTLSEEERLQREIIETMLRLILREGVREG